MRGHFKPYAIRIEYTDAEGNVRNRIADIGSWHEGMATFLEWTAPGAVPDEVVSMTFYEQVTGQVYDAWHRRGE